MLVCLQRILLDYFDKDLHFAMTRQECLELNFSAPDAVAVDGWSCSEHSYLKGVLVLKKVGQIATSALFEASPAC